MNATEETGYIVEHRQSWQAVASGAVVLAGTLVAAMAALAGLEGRSGTPERLALAPAIELRGSDLGQPAREWQLRRSPGPAEHDDPLPDEPAALVDQTAETPCD